MLQLLALYLPALIPSWRFFQEVGASPRVEFRIMGPSGAEPWMEAGGRPDCIGLWGSVLRLIWNADRNEALYVTSLAERLVLTGDAFAKSEIHSRLCASLPLDMEGALQYRVLLLHGPDMPEVAFESSALALEALR